MISWAKVAAENDIKDSKEWEKLICAFNFQMQVFLGESEPHETVLAPQGKTSSFTILLLIPFSFLQIVCSSSQRTFISLMLRRFQSFKGSGEITLGPHSVRDTDTPFGRSGNFCWVGADPLPAENSELELHSKTPT